MPHPRSTDPSTSSNDSLHERLRQARVLPVLTIDDATTAPDLARVLVDAGLRTLEVTLRTPASLRALEAMRRAVDDEPGDDDVWIGAGTVTTTEELTSARDAGARFAVSPGAPPDLLRGARSDLLRHLPLLPGVATATEAMTARDAGYRTLKLFPAETAGGVALLRALAGPLPDLAFCPTGGVDAVRATEYLPLANVICVGGSWMAPRRLIASRDWQTIGTLSRQAVRDLGR